MNERDGPAVVDDERVIHRGDDRHGGEIAVTDERVLVGGERRTIAVPLENVESLSYLRINWKVAVTTLVLVVVGAAALLEGFKIGAAIAVAGVLGFAITWRRRGSVRIHYHTRPRPLECHPEEPDALLAAADEALVPYREGDADGESDAADATYDD